MTSYDPRKVKILIGEGELTTYAEDLHVCGVNIIIKDLANYPKGHTDYSEDLVLVKVASPPITFKIRKDSKQLDYIRDNLNSKVSVELKNGARL